MTGRILQALSEREMELGPFGTDVGLAERWSHWHLRMDDNDVAWLVLDHADSSANVLSASVLEELGEILTQLKKDKPKGLVLRSAKASNFCVGADIKEFHHLNNESEAAEKLREAHKVADQLAGLRFPTVAVVHGTCFGGGLELALCCDYRIAVPGASLGFPEIQLGLHPGLGGTGRSIHLIDPVAAMTMMLTGKPANERKAKKLGLVDLVAHERHVANAVKAALNGKVKKQKPGFKARAMNTKPAREFAARKMRSQSAAKAPPQHYPAPNALIALWENHGGSDKKMRKAEVDSFAKLLATDTSRNLVRVFFLREKMKGLANLKHTDTQHGFGHVHVVGAGAMGGDIAGWCALKGLTVSLFDMKPDMVAQAVKNLAKLCDRKRLSQAEKRRVMDRLIPDFHNHGVPQADLVIEAVPEKIDIKQKVYEDVEPQLKEGAILATNTSSIPLEQLQEHLIDPSRLVGLHFFNPVAKMQLVEVVRHDAVHEQTVEKALAFTGTISRLPAPVTSAPGFLVNRALTPYLLEAMIMLDEGVAAESIDKAAEDFGMPMGPVKLADQVGLDICLGVADMLRERLDTTFPDIPDWLRKKVQAGDLGKKSGRGLYDWEDGKAQKKDEPPTAPDDTLDRLILPMLNACMACLREGVIDDDEVLDGAMIFGTGFAPFRGGPMHYARQRGFGEIRSALDTLATSRGARFKPHEGWSSDASG